MIEVAGVILAGGKSRRMGKDKSLLEFRGQTLLQRIINEHNRILKNVYVIGKEEKYFKNAIAIKDKIEKIGPVAGIYSALTEIKAEWYLVSPCDMPFLTHVDLEIILDECKTSQVEAVIAKSQKGTEPLVAAYKKDILPLVEKNIKNGDFAIRAVFNQITKRYLKFNEQIFEKDTFFNINYPDDYKNALKIEN